MKRFKIKLFLWLISIVMICVGLLCFFAVRIRPVIVTATRGYAQNTVSQVIDEEVKKIMLEEFLSYEKITIITRDSSGNVTSVSTNGALINKFTNNLGMAIGDRLDEISMVENHIPLGNIFGIDLFSGMGPDVPVKFFPISVTNADITHEFEESGINQTLHTINLVVSVDMAIMLPLARNSVTVSSSMPIAQTLIVGRVPDAFLKK